MHLGRGSLPLRYFSRARLSHRRRSPSDAAEWSHRDDSALLHVERPKSPGTGARRGRWPLRSHCWRFLVIAVASPIGWT